MASKKTRCSTPLEETYNLQLGSEWQTRVLLSMLYIEYAVYSWGWLSSGLPDFHIQNQNAITAWFLKFISVVVLPLRSIWASNNFFKVSIRWLSAVLHYYCLVYFVTCILITGIFPALLILHAVNYH